MWLTELVHWTDFWPYANRSSRWVGKLGQKSSYIDSQIVGHSNSRRPWWRQNLLTTYVNISKPFQEPKTENRKPRNQKTEIPKPTPRREREGERRTEREEVVSSRLITSLIRTDIVKHFRASNSWLIYIYFSLRFVFIDSTQLCCGKALNSSGKNWENWAWAGGIKKIMFRSHKAIASTNHKLFARHFLLYSKYAWAYSVIN